MSEREIDWSVLEYPGVRAAARRAVAKVCTEYSGVSGVEFDDLLQEAYINLATHPDVVREYVNGPDGLGGLNHWVWCDLVDQVRVQANRSNRTASFEALQEDGEDVSATLSAPQTDEPPAGGDYSRELVEQLLPAVWDSSYAFGMTNPSAPDPDMPRATIDVSHGCTLYAHLADIRTAWKRAPLTLKEKRATLLRYGLGWDHREIGAHEGVSRQAITARLDTAVGKMRDHLNGVALGAATW